MSDPTKAAGAFSFVLAVLCILSVIGFVVAVYNAGVRKGKDSCELSVATTIIEKVEKREKKKQEIIRLDDDALVRRYCRFVYGIPYADCVRTVKPLP